MSGYLQRLIDRSAGAPVGVTAVTPANPSASPLALRDQRLQDPSLLHSLPTGSGWMAAGSAPAPEAETGALEESPLPAGSGGGQERVTASPAAAVAIPPGPSQPANRFSASRLPYSPRSPLGAGEGRPPQVVEQRSYEGDTPSVNEGQPWVVGTPPPSPQPTTAPLSRDAASKGHSPVSLPFVGEMVAAIQRQSPDGTPLVEVMPPQGRPMESKPIGAWPVIPPPSGALAPTATSLEPPPLPPPSPPPGSAIPAEPTAAPPVIALEPPPLPPPPRPVPGPIPAAEAPAAPPTPREGERRSEEVPLPRPPVTAASVSLIGPLGRRRRSYTLFGGRRR
jgi:hypothetical protein